MLTAAASLVTMSVEDVRESRTMVRMYSWDVEERIPPESDAHSLGQSLIEDRGDRESLTAPWRKFFERQKLSQNNGDPLTDVIAVESARLREKWVAFQTSCPKDERLDLTNSEPTLEGVVDIVREMTTAWRTKRDKSRRGKTAKLFHAFCSKLDSHSSLMKLLPEGNAYVSVFMGSLGAVIKASVNHEHIAEGFATSLCQISEHIIWCQWELELFHTKFMLEQVADLYAHIFLFLSSIMDWLTEKRHRRMLDSFNENFNKRFEDEIAAINRKAEALRRRAEYSSHAELRAMRLDLEDMRQDYRIGLEGNARYFAERQHFEERMAREALEAQKEREQSRVRWTQLSGFVKHMLSAGAIESIHSNQTVFIPLQLAGMMDQRVEDMNAQAVGGGGVSQWGLEKVSFNSKNLEDSFHRDRLRLLVDPTEPVLVNQDTLVALSEWSASTDRRALWLEGPSIEVDDVDNPMSMLAARIIDIAEQSQVPVISYFCELRRGETLRPGETRETQAMIGLLYALIRQLVELLLPRFETQVDLSEPRFKRLDGTLKSWADAMAIFRDLLPLGPNKVFCVIDGLHWLDDRDTEKYLHELAGVFQEEQHLKVLFTTTGRSACLLKEISALDTVEVKIGRPSDDTLGVEDNVMGSM
ncbi:hypothetical protein FE257_003322 [Aspergillus nanangensis]|uniref:Uncharacterized protein n=1 Tax=Aspergillus nanangensis TaxID=2582783 RepID=A0AAD4GWF8_ASPNN|nr:hypothetical protein FE257_003322 [Aspergillus nanangensis]